MIDETLANVAARLTPTARVSVLTGAGVSAASGVPTFRGSNGLWRRVRPETLATPEAFARNPRLVWEWYDWRRGLIAQCRPNRAHEVLAAWSRRFSRFTLITQNVDGLHQAAGTRDVVALHGSIWHLQCHARCDGRASEWRDDRVPILEAVGDRIQPLPSCPRCGGPARPAVVWFGETLDPAVLDQARAATACDVFLAIGTSAVVYPAAGLLFEAKRSGAFTVEINPAVTEASASVDAVIAQPAEVALDELECLLTPVRSTFAPDLS